jgi:hypothetical protein
MRPVNQEGKAPLAPAVRKRLLDYDLPYRVDHLRDAVSRVPAKSFADNQAFEAGAVAGRVVLEFLGVGYDAKKGGLTESRVHSRNKAGLTDDVKVVDLGGNYVSISDISPQDQDTLAKFIRGVHKACAHFTIDSDHQLTTPVFRAAAPVILRLYDAHAPKA